MTLSSLTVLGCSGTYAGPSSACSGYLVRSPGASLWVDCGTGTLGAVQRHVPLPELTAGIVVSHCHPDHWLELPVVRNALKYVMGCPDLELPVWTTAETAQMLDAVMDSPVFPTFDMHVIDESSVIDVADLQVRFSRTDHPVETLAVRVDTPHGAIAYTADTGPDWSLASLGPGIDLAVVEATITEEGTNIPHLTAGQAGRQAAEAEVGRLVLTHLLPGTDAEYQVDDAARYYDGPIELAAIDERFEL